MKDDSLILKATGVDAGTFLQGQLACDTSVLASDRWTYSAYCTSQGNVLALLWVFPWTDGVLLRLPRATAPAFLAQIRKYIQDSDVHISETALHFGALAGDNPSDEQRLIPADGKTLIGGVPGVIPYISAQPQADALPAETWYAARIRAGIPEIYADTAGQFTPAMLNLAALGAISPKKNGYIGSDAIARQPHKAHHHLATASAPALASSERTLYAKGKVAGTLLDYGHDATGTILQAVIEDRYLGKALHLRDETHPLHFQRAATP